MERGQFSFDQRTCGVLLHPTALPSGAGAGDLGQGAYRFADFLAAAHQRWWQMLPIGPLGRPPGYSPYSSTSAMAGSPWLISLQGLVEEGLLKKTELPDANSLPGALIDYAQVIRTRDPLLRLAYERFVNRWGDDEDFAAFRETHRAWLDDFALFSAIKQAYRGKPWDEWEKCLRLRDRAALATARQELAPEVRFCQFVQWIFDRQWQALRSYCHQRGVGLIGDIPIFVAYDSVDVWANRHLFLLDRQGRPTVVTGCPPDAFAAAGQKWNHPQYDWAAHRKEGYAWWLARFEGIARQFDAVRIDHFLGFQRAWHIPATAKDARRGKWVPGPGAPIFTALRQRLPHFPIIAEDLGALTPQAATLRDQFAFPGMRVLQFGFGEGGDMHLPHRHLPRCVAYTGTHDNQTAAGWFKRLPRGSERAKTLDYLGATPGKIHLDMIRAVMNSVANTAIVPIQDWLGLGDEARVNIPGVDRGNWRWRLAPGMLTPRMASQMKRLAEISDRIAD